MRYGHIHNYVMFWDYRVTDVASVDEFISKYYKRERLQDVTIASAQKEVTLSGYDIISHHSSVTGEVVAYMSQLPADTETLVSLASVRNDIIARITSGVLPDMQSQYNSWISSANMLMTDVIRRMVQ